MLKISMLGIVYLILGTLPAIAGAPVENSSRCPIQVIPGRSLGPIQIGATRADLVKAHVNWKKEIHSGEMELFETPLYNIRLDKGLVKEVWIDDLRKAPDCLYYRGKKISRETRTVVLVTDGAARVQEAGQKAR